MLSRRSIRLGRIHGVEVTVDPSWFIFAAVIAWLLGQNFTSGPTPVVASSMAGFALGLLGAVLFFVSVLSHELSHAVVAQRKGIAVPRITLFIFGGVAQIAEEPHTAGDEVKIALAGPALSFVLGALLYALGTVSGNIGSAAGASLFHTVGAANLFLGTFNLLPGFPLDGGRVLRAAVWQATGNFVKATKVAAISGRVIAMLMMALGATLALLGRDPVDGIWLVMIGLFLHSAAQGAYRHVTAGQASPPVGQLMTPAPAWVPSYALLDDGLHQQLAASRDRAVPVVGPDGMIAGVLTAETLEATPREYWPQLSAGQVMVPMHAGMVAAPQEPFAAVLSRLAMNPSGRFVVLDAGRLVGMLTPGLLLSTPDGRSIQPSAQSR